MKKYNRILLTACFLLLTATIYAQPLSKSKEIEEYDKEFVEALKKPWKKMILQKTENDEDELEGLIEDKLHIGILPQNEEIMKYDLFFAEQLKNENNWREMEFAPMDTFDMTKPKSRDIISKKKVPMFASRDGSRYKPKPEKLLIKVDYKQKLRSRIGEIALIDNINFYGYEFPIYYDPKINIYTKDNVKNYPLDSPMEVTDFWKVLAKSEWGLFLDQVKDYAKVTNFDFDDWGYALLINKIAKKIYLHNHNATVLLTCFMLNHSGLRAKITYDLDGNLDLWLVTKDKILNALPEYDAPYTYRRYNFRSPSSEKSIDTTITPNILFEPPHTEMRPIDSFIRKMPKFLNSIKYDQTINFKFEHNGIEERVSANVNLNRLKYYEDIPPTTLDVYFKASCFIKHNAQLIYDLRVLLRKIDSYEEKVNLLLSFTSSNDAMCYAPDRLTLFPEQTLYNNESDCEDRAVLFAALYSHLIGDKIIGIKYKKPNDHVIVAIPHRSKTPLEEFDHFQYKNKNNYYVLCDPTAEGPSYGKISNERRNRKQDYDPIDFIPYCID